LIHPAIGGSATTTSSAGDRSPPDPNCKLL
jgi:hypothetical protein